MKNNKYLLYKLINIDGFGVATLNIILNKIKIQNKTLEDFFNFSEKEFEIFFPEFGKGRFTKISYNSLVNIDEEVIQRSYDNLVEKGVRIVTCFDEDYPKIISERFNNLPPLVLFCKGIFQLLNTNSVSIVGSRFIDHDGMKIVAKISQCLSDNEYNIVSGYAKGVDMVAHSSALKSGGTTTVVLSCGINQGIIKDEIKSINNWENSILLISQFKPNEPWSARNAMDRNKLVCAISKAVVVIYSGPEKDSQGKMSGTFNAGVNALKMGIPLFVLSPKLFESNPAGNKELISMGAIEVTDYEKIHELIGKVQKNKKENMALF